MNQHPPFIVGIAGGSASGKTAFANDLVRLAPENSTTLIAIDAYYVNNSHFNFAERQAYNYDHPDAFEFDLLIEHLKQLKLGKSVNIPIHNYATYLRIDQTEQKDPNRLVIVEGVLTLVNQSLRELFDLTVFINTTDEVRLRRRTERDVRERGRTEESVLNQWNKTVQPMFLEYCKPTIDHAEIVINGEAWGEKEINSVLKHKKLSVNLTYR
ncbi:MAG: uridine kinase [Bdellovibrionota bacterium]